MKTVTILVASVLALVLCTHCTRAAVDNAATFSASGFIEDKSGFLNPERGWYRSMETNEATLNEMESFKNARVTLAMLEANLGDYLAGPLDEKKLAEIENAFTMARNTGLSVIFRAAYDFDGKRNPEPADMDIMLKHISQLKPIFYKNEDILFNVQAGFLGSWGEWHSTRYGGGLWKPPGAEYQRTIANALLEAVPPSVTVAFRRPEYIRNIAGHSQPVSQAQAFGSEKIARLAFHNDALMSDSTDMETYAARAFPRDAELAWIGQHTRYTPLVAETNQVSRYNDTERAIPFLDSINIQSLNIEYHPNVLRKWKNSSYDDMNAYDYIGMMMGYRFVLKTANISVLPDHGGSLRIDLELVNSGFGNLMKKKNFELVLKNGKRSYRAAIDEDARFWNKNEPVSRSYYFRLPSGMGKGDWDVYLALSSAFKSLADNPAYAVRFANEDIWDAGLGLNKIGTLHLDAATGGRGGSKLLQIKEQTP